MSSLSSLCSLMIFFPLRILAHRLKNTTEETSLLPTLAVVPQAWSDHTGHSERKADLRACLPRPATAGRLLLTITPRDDAAMGSPAQRLLFPQLPQASDIQQLSEWETERRSFCTFSEILTHRGRSRGSRFSNDAHLPVHEQ